VIVVYDILIEHFSSGSYNKDWVVAVEKFTAKWKTQFPVSLISLSEQEMKGIEIEAIRFYRDVCLKQKLFLRAIRVIWLLIEANRSKTSNPYNKSNGDFN
jgi:hypothetical protein